MKQSLGKGTEIHQFFGEYYKFLSEFFIPENSEEYWSELQYRVDLLLRPYSKCDFYILAKGIVLVTVNYLEIKYKPKAHDGWLIMILPKGKKVRLVDE